MRAHAIGARAHAALLASAGIVRPLPGFVDAPYMRAGDEIVWIGARVRTMHPRMIALDAPVDREQVLRIEHVGLTPWRAPAHPGGAAISAHVRASVAAILATLADGMWSSIVNAESPRGFGHVLSGARPPFPLDLALARVRAFTDALDLDDDDAILRSATPLLGLGTGLTPSGDDLVGGALFARRLCVTHPARCDALGARILDVARVRTHAISHALLDDSARGATYELLHDVARSLASGNVNVHVHAPCLSALGRIGHSSGWDMLTGFFAAIAPDRVRAALDRLS